MYVCMYQLLDVGVPRATLSVGVTLLDSENINNFCLGRASLVSLVSICQRAQAYVSTSYCNSHWTGRVVLKVQGSLAYRECDMTSLAPLTCAEAIRGRAAVIRQPRQWWGFAEWLAWGWARKTRVKMLLV